MKRIVETNADTRKSNQQYDAMKLYILRWNPQISSYKTEDFQQRLVRLGRKGCCGLMMNWSIYEHKNLKPGDWFVFSRVGGNDDGIAGLGRFTSQPYPGESWRRDGTQIMYADMVTLMLNEPTQSGMWKAESLETDFPEIDWHGGHAGIPIAPDVAERLALKLAKDLARLPKERIPGLAIRGGNGGRFTIVCGILSHLCPQLLKKAKANQTATDAMAEKYMPSYRDSLTADMHKLANGEEPLQCVHLLDWTGIYSAEDFNINTLLNPKNKKLSMKEKFKRLLSLEQKYDDELPDYWESPKVKARIALFTEDLQATIDFLDNDCDGEMLADMSAVFYEISMQLQSWEFIDALERCAERYPVETEKYNIRNSIEDAIGALNNDVYFVRERFRVRVADNDEATNKWLSNNDETSHMKTYIFTAQEIEFLNPLFDAFNDNFDIFIVAYDTEFIKHEHLAEALKLTEDFVKEHSSSDFQQTCQRFLEAVQHANDNKVWLIFDF